LVYAAIVGVPTDLVADPNNLDYEAILNDPRMIESVDATGDKLKPSCNVATGLAYPPRRMVDLARQLEERGSNGIVQSICQDDFTPALTAIIEKIADVLGGACLPRALNPGPDGSVNCDVTERLPAIGDFTTCASLASLGRDPEPIRREIVGEDEVEVCRVNQIVPDRRSGAVPVGTPGWYYDDFSSDVMTRCADTPQRISFSAGAEPKTGVLVRLECFQPARDDVGSGIRVTGDGCGDLSTGAPENDICTCTGTAEQIMADPRRDCMPEPTIASEMICDPRTITCQVPCGSNADCRARLGLGGLICDVEAPMPVCVNPTCQ